MMEITGNQLVHAPRQVVWNALFDPLVLKRCLPGCVSVERRGDDAFDVVMTAAVGPLRARFNGSLLISEADAPSSCKLSFEGQGGVVGFGKGQSSVQLREADGDRTELAYTAEAQVGGKLAQVGSRLIDSVARKMADDFFSAFRRHLAGGNDSVAEVPTTSAPAAEHVDPPSRAPSIDAEPVLTTTAAATTEIDDVGSPAFVRPPAAAAAAPLAVCPSGLASSWVETRVPGWWLAVAAVLGSIATGFGALISR